MAIQGIQYYRYKRVLSKLETLMQSKLSKSDKRILEEQVNLLTQIYTSYQKSLDNVTVIIKLFEQQEIAIKKTIQLQKKLRNTKSK